MGIGMYSRMTVTAERGAHLPKQQTPGAGEYEPSMAQEHTRGGESMFRSKDERFRKSMELEYAAHRGPGSYNQVDRTIERDALRNGARVTPGFASTTLRHGGFLERGCAG